MAISKQRFISILSDPSSIESKDLEGLEDIVQKYPYCYLAYALIAKYKYDNQHPDANDSLNVAAISMPNRKKLKYLFYNDLEPVSAYGTPFRDKQSDESSLEGSSQLHQAAHENIDSLPAQDDSVNKTEYSSMSSSHESTSDKGEKEDRTSSLKAGHEYSKATSRTFDDDDETYIPGDDKAEKFRSELEENLKALKRYRESFFLKDSEKEASQSDKSKSEETSAVTGNSTAKASTSSRTRKGASGSSGTKVKSTAGSTKKASGTNSSSSGQGKRNRRSESASGEDSDSSAEDEGPGQYEDKKKRTLTNEALPDYNDTYNPPNFLDHVTLHDDEKSGLSNSRQEEQQYLIDHFINNVSQKGLKDIEDAQNEEEQEDLSNTSTKFQENLISENLAQLMVKQKKPERAIEIYKKLIWKFPQKKAYFAEKIKSIKES